MNKLQRTIDEGKARKAKQGMTNFNKDLESDNPAAHMPRESVRVITSHHGRYVNLFFRGREKEGKPTSRTHRQEAECKLIQSKDDEGPSPLISYNCCRHKYHVYLNFCPHTDFIKRFLKYKSKRDEDSLKLKIGSERTITDKYCPRTLPNPRSDIVVISKNQPTGDSKISHNVMVLFPSQVQFLHPTMALVTPGNILLLISLPHSPWLTCLASIPIHKQVALFPVSGHKITALQSGDLFSGPMAQVISDSCRRRTLATGTERISMRREFFDICTQSTFY